MSFRGLEEHVVAKKLTWSLRIPLTPHPHPGNSNKEHLRCLPVSSGWLEVSQCLLQMACWAAQWQVGPSCLALWSSWPACSNISQHTHHHQTGAGCCLHTVTLSVSVRGEREEGGHLTVPIRDPQTVPLSFDTKQFPYTAYYFHAVTLMLTSSPTTDFLINN